ncbi:LysM peptidoglycan-binding domain-containing protein [Micromonospora craniellae]|uniref:LysM peptidoglycan-binding domain-containing protein n=1 Tax=Micromonospora craniellae TaxID=2294034 RepID=UPI0011C0E494|nr:hypothetical protein [Micromonospora craniellae]
MAVVPAPSVSPEADGPVKYYVVSGDPAEREFLFGIAAKTLGDGRRAGEIFELNKGRPQPDGGRLDDPLLLRPGWILLLPADATGAGVIAGVPSPDAGAMKPPATTSTTRVAPATADGGGAARFAMLVLVTATLGVALHLLSRGRRIEMPARPRPAPRAATVRPADTGSPARPRASARRVGNTEGPVRRRSSTVVTVVLPAPPVVGAVTSGRPAVPPTESPPATAPAAKAVPPVVVAVEPGVAVGTTEAVPEPSAEREETTRPPDHDAVPNPVAGPGPARSLYVRTIPEDPTTTLVKVTVRSGPDLLTVRLVGARPDAGAHFVGRGDVPRSGTAVVQLGDPGPDALWVDLAACPDLVRITGAMAGVRRQATLLAGQLSRAGAVVTTMGDVPAVTGPGTRGVRSLDGLLRDPGQAAVTAVFLNESEIADTPTLHQLVRRLRPRVVPVALGDGRRSRWSIDVT